jgi:hypothetical protein
MAAKQIKCAPSQVRRLAWPIAGQEFVAVINEATPPQWWDVARWFVRIEPAKRLSPGVVALNDGRAFVDICLDRWGSIRGERGNRLLDGSGSVILLTRVTL